ncbi:MAG: hypothetical protein Kow00120_13730 [Anaerolineae bacterium]
MNPIRWWRDRPLALLCLAFVALSCLNNAATPLFENPDEHGHYQYVLDIASGGGLPVLPRVRNEEDPWRYHEGGQGPLYYATAAIPVALSGAAPMDPLLYHNPYFYMFEALDPTNKNVFVHTAAEAFPWQGAALGVHLARGVSTGFGLLAVVGAYLLALEIVPKNVTGWTRGLSPSSKGVEPRRLALLAAAVVAFNPMFLAVSGAVSNDAAVAGLSAIALWLMARVLNGGGAWRVTLALGVVSGLAVLAKTSALAAVPLAALVVIVARLRGRLPISLWRAAALILLPAALICGWWFARNHALYGELTGTTALMQTLGYPGAPYRTAFLTDPAVFVEEFRGLRYSFWALFGWFKILVPLFWYHVLDALSLLGVVGLAALAVGRWRARRWDDLLRLGLVAAWAGAVFAGVTLYNVYLDAYHGRLLFPALSAVALLLVLGLDWLAAWLRARWAAAVLPVTLAALAALAPLVYVRPTLVPPPPMDRAAIPETATPVNLRYGEGVGLLAASVDEASVAPGAKAHVTLYWEALAAMDADYTLDLQLLGQDVQPVTIISTFPGGGTWPTSQWEPGTVARDTYVLPVGETVATPAVAWVVARFLDGEQGALPVYDAAGERVEGLPIVGWTRFRPGAAPPPARPLDADFAAIGVRLVGYDVAYLDDGALGVTLHWSVDQDVSEDLTVFVHALNENGVLIEQGDGPPVGGNYPTWAWLAGDVVVDQHRVPLPDDAVPYEVAIGLYRLSDGTRIPVAVGGELLEGDAVRVLVEE